MDTFTRRASGLLVPPELKNKHAAKCELFGGAMLAGGSGGPLSIWAGYTGSLDGTAVLAKADVPYSSNNASLISCGGGMFSDTKGIVCWPSNGATTWNNVTMKVFNVSGVTPSFGAEQSINTDGNMSNVNGSPIRALRMDDTHMLLTWDKDQSFDGLQYGVLLTLNPSTDVVTASSVAASGTNSTAGQNSTFRLNATQAITVGMAVNLWTISGTSVSVTQILGASTPYGRGGGGRIDDNHFWVHTKNSDSTVRISVYSLSGTSATEVVGITEPWGSNSAAYQLGSTTAIIQRFNGSGAVLSFATLDINPSSYALTRTALASAPPVSFWYDNPQLTLPDAHLYIAPTGTSYTNVRVQTVNTGDSVFSSPVDVAPYNYSHLRLRAFPSTTPNKALLYYGVNRDLYVKIIRAN